MEVGTAGQHRQGLVGGVAAQIRPQVHGMPGGIHKPQIGAVGIVYQQQRAVAAAYRRQGGNIRHISQIIRAGDVHRCGGLLCQMRIQIFRPNGAGEVGCLLIGNEPIHIQVQQRNSAEEYLVGVPSGGDDRLFALGLGVDHGQVQHGPDALGGAFRGVEGGVAEESRGVFLALPDDTRSFIQTIGAGNLRDVQFLHTQRSLTFVTGHMEPHLVIIPVAPDEVHDGGIHRLTPRARAMATIMAHSMRLRNRRQPFS